jgi:hypothetical protein
MYVQRLFLAMLRLSQSAALPDPSHSRWSEKRKFRIS